MRAPRLGLALVTHCLLPSAGVRPETLTRAEGLKYVDATIGILIETFALRGAAIPELEVKLIGGADNLRADGAPSFYSVGGRNVRMAMDDLADRGIIPMAAIVGGRSGRVMVFDSGTGDVFVKLLSPDRRAFGEDS
jgi:chemotaxis protein CheD